MECPVIGCEKIVQKGRPTCEMHYMRMRRNGDYYERKATPPLTLSSSVGTKKNQGGMRSE